MSKPTFEIDADAGAPPAPAVRADSALGSPRLWLLAWLVSVGGAALLLLTGDAARTPWAAIGALLLGALAVIGGVRAYLSLSRADAPVAPAAPFAPPPRVAQPLAAAPAPSAPEPPTWSRPSAEAELARLQAVMSELPELGLLMDRDGRADVVFGRAIEGVSTEVLHAGVTALADEPDRSAVGRALAQAWSGGFAEATFALARAPTRRLRLSVRPTGEGGLAGVLTHVSSAPTGGVALAQAREALAAAVAERDVAMAENANKSRFLATMSHELRTPLNAIVGFSDIMRLKMFGPLPERYGEYAELIHESGRHLTDLINDVLDMSKIEADRYVLQREAFDARDAVSGAMKLLRLQAEDAGLHLRADLPAAPLRVDADRRALKQIVLNLVSNALKFTPPGGRVDVTLCALDGAMELVVADTGQGVSAEDLARLGKPYEQTDAGRRVQGTGLGLSLVKALTALHGGEFLMESRLGEGSAATVRLPVLTTAAPTPADELAPEPLL